MDRTNPPARHSLAALNPLITSSSTHPATTLQRVIHKEQVLLHSIHHQLFLVFHIQCSAPSPSGPFPTFPFAWSGCRNPNLPFHVVASPEVRNISPPTQVGANWSSTPHVQSHDASSESRHSTMQPPEAERRKTTGEIFSRTCFVLK